MSLTKVHERDVVALMGRFGNQLFQYSFAKWLARETEREVRLDLAMTRTVGSCRY